MRKTTTCLLVLLCALAAVGQGQQQWKVVQHGILTHQTAAISQTTLFTPKRSGLYRLSGYISQSDQGGASWKILFFWNDFTGAGQLIQLPTEPQSVGQIGGYLFFPEAGVPVSYMVEGSGGTYNIAFTIEQLQ